MNQFDFIPEGIQDCTVTAWLHTSGKNGEMPNVSRPAVLICPGGGYEFVSDREAEPVAKTYFAAGYHTFILYYAVQEKAANFYPLCQLASAMAHIRSHAAQWFVDPDKIAVCGFSAGGHLAASLGTLYREERFLKVFHRTEHIRPDAMILGYPVITADEYAHRGSIEHVSGAKDGEESYTWFGLDRHVDSATPPAFLWHTSQDDCVPVENSLRMAAAFSAAKVPFELHVLPHGGHGMSTCTAEVNTPNSYNARWTEWSIRWLNALFCYQH